VPPAVFKTAASFRIFLLLALSVVLSACVSSVDQLRKMNLKGDDFQSELARQYLDFAESEADQYDWFNSAYFARKGLKVIKGENPPPEDLEKWSFQEEVVPTLVQAREYLLSVLDPETQKKFPKQAATAQFMFDCWVEQQEEGWQKDDIEHCREGFYKNLDSLFALTAKPAIEAPIALVEPPKEPEKTSKTETKIAYFKTDSSELDDSAKRIVSNIVSRLKDVKSYDITLNGYADNIGSEEMNMKLSKNRALAIKKALTDGRLDAKLITIFAFGNTEGRVKTPKNTHAKENRAVEIVVDMK